MSDFLGRLAARNADSAAPAVVPRAASRFEGPAPAIQRDAIEVDSAVAARDSERRSESAPASAPRPGARPQQPSVVVATPREPGPIRPVERAEPMRTRVEQMIKEVETITTSRTVVNSLREVVRDKQIVASPVIPRIDKSPESHSIALSRAVTSQARAGEREPTVIRVHIGRVEVRANPVQVDRPRVRSTQRTDLPKPMSLDRYLTGKDRS